MLLEKTWPFIEKSRNQIALMRAYKLPLMYTNKSVYDEFFGTHTAIKLVTSDINSSLLTLMFQQLSELNKGMMDLSLLCERTSVDVENVFTGVKELQAQMILVNHLWEGGTNVFKKFLKYSGDKNEAEDLKETIINFRKETQELYAAIKDYEPFKIYNLNQYFINIKGLLKNDKEEFNKVLRDYPKTILSMRAFSTFLTLLPNAIRVPSTKNYMAIALEERMKLKTVTNLDDEQMIDYFIPRLNDFGAKKLDEMLSLNFEYQFIENFRIFKYSGKHFIDQNVYKNFKNRNKDVVQKITYSYMNDITLEGGEILKKQLEFFEQTIFKKDFSVINKNIYHNKILFGGELSFEGKTFLRKDIEGEAVASHISLAEVTGYMSYLYDYYILDKIKIKTDSKVVITEEEKTTKRFIAVELKEIPKTLMFGHNVKIMKDLFNMRENSEELNKKLEVFYLIRQQITEIEKKDELSLDSLNRLRCIYKGLEGALNDMKPLIEEDCRYMFLKSATSEEKPEKKVKKKKI